MVSLLHDSIPLLALMNKPTVQMYYTICKHYAAIWDVRGLLNDILDPDSGPDKEERDGAFYDLHAVNDREHPCNA